MFHLFEQLWGGVSCQDGWGHVRTDSVELLDLSLPHLQQALTSFIHPLPPRPLTLQVEREARLLPLSPETTNGNMRQSCLIWEKGCYREEQVSSLTWKGPLQLLWLSWWCDPRSLSRSTRSGLRRQCEAGDVPLPGGILEHRKMKKKLSSFIYPWKQSKPLNLNQDVDV